jgi:hypothetical protein
VGDGRGTRPENHRPQGGLLQRQNIHHMNTPATALIAEDEPLLAQTLQNELHALWPALHVLFVGAHPCGRWAWHTP